MRFFKVLIVIAVSLGAMTAFGQQDLYSRITPLEAKVTSDNASRAEQLELAQLYAQVQRYYEASKIVSRLLASDPNDAEALKLRDVASKGLREVQDRNIAQAETAAHRDGATDQDRLALGNAYFEAGSYGAAADAYAHLPASLLDRDARLRQARALAWSSRLDESERVYSTLLKEQSSPDLQLEYGRLLSWMGASRAAVDTLQKTFDANRTDDNAVALANAMSWSGNRDGAIKLLNDFVAANPGATQSKLLAEQLAASPELRLERVSRLIEIEPYNLALQMEKARLLLDAGRYSEVLTTTKFIREHSNQNIDGLDEIEHSARERRQQELAKLEDRRKALDAQAASATSSDRVLALAKDYTALADYRSSERLYERYLKMHPDDFTARIQYARVLSWDQRYDASAHQYETILRANPDRADLRLEYAQVLSYQSDFGPAMAQFRQLTDVSANPRANLYSEIPPKAYFNLGQIYRWYGWNDTAVADQTQALALDAGYMPARQELDLVRHLRPTSTIDGRYTYSTDSADFTLKQIDLTAQKWLSQRTAYDLSVGRHEFEHRGDSVFANVISGGASYRKSDQLSFHGRVGANFYDQGLGTRPFFGVGAQWLPNLQSRYVVDFNHYDLVYDVFTLNSLATPGTSTNVGSLINDPISINDLRGHYDYNTGGHWSWLADASFGSISDDNKREAAHGLLTYRLFKQPFVAIKADGRYLRYDFRTPRYYSPHDYRSIAGVLQVGQNIHNRFFWDAEVKAGRSYEAGHSSDLRSYDGNVTVPVNDRIDLVGNYGYGKSGRLDSISPFGGSSTDFLNYWQRHWYVGFRLKQLYGKGNRPDRNPYYYDTRPLTGSSPVIPGLGEKR